MTPFLLASVSEGVGSILPMVLVGGVLLATLVAIAFELVHKSLAAVAGAIVAVVTALLRRALRHPHAHDWPQRRHSVRAFPRGLPATR